MTRLPLDRGLDVQAFDYAPSRDNEGVFPLAHYPEIEAFLSPDPVRLPFGSGEFDAVLGLGVLEHVARPHEGLEELERCSSREERSTATSFRTGTPTSRSSPLLGLYYHGELPDDAVYTKRSAVALKRAHGFTVGEFRHANMLPVTIAGQWATAAAAPVSGANRALAKVPVVNLLSTNLELVATAPRS